MEDIDSEVKGVTGTKHLGRGDQQELEYFWKVQGRGDKEHEPQRKSRSCWGW